MCIDFSAFLCLNFNHGIICSYVLFPPHLLQCTQSSPQHNTQRQECHQRSLFCSQKLARIPPKQHQGESKVVAKLSVPAFSTQSLAPQSHRTCYTKLTILYVQQTQQQSVHHALLLEMTLELVCCHAVSFLQCIGIFIGHLVRFSSRHPVILFVGGIKKSKLLVFFSPVPYDKTQVGIFIA